MPRTRTKPRRAIDPGWSRERKAQLRRTVRQRLKAFAASGEYRWMLEQDAAKEAKAAKEKAPGLTTEGSSDPVIPGEDPGPQETQALAATPARPCRPSGITALTD